MFISQSYVSQLVEKGFNNIKNTIKTEGILPFRATRSNMMETLSKHQGQCYYYVESFTVLELWLSGDTDYSNEK